ncbi:MAG: sigma-70 family RNA polymerase sigma factor [Caldimonas sp.]
MHGVPSSLILRNESWVRKQAQSVLRRVPSNVEKADLIQVGLIAVAQASLAFVWEGDRETEEANEAFVRYARMRVKGAMLDELRQMDHLGRAQRRKVKVVELAAERWRASHGTEPSAAELSQVCGIGSDEIFELERVARSAQTTTLAEDGASDEVPTAEAATARDEVEARVDTGIMLRRLEKFFATLPERERQVIDSYLGIGLSPVKLAESLNVTPSRVSQLFKSICERIGIHLGHEGQRSTDRVAAGGTTNFDELITSRETDLAGGGEGAWGEFVERVLIRSSEPASGSDDAPIVVTDTTRWG